MALRRAARRKQWRAFLSVASDADGQPVNAIDRIGEGPWYDRLGRLVANTRADLLHDRPAGADPAIVNDLPNENGIPNKRPEPTLPEEDNHHTLTGSDTQGALFGAMATCRDWTSAKGDPRTGGPAADRPHLPGARAAVRTAPRGTGSPP